MKLFTFYVSWGNRMVEYQTKKAKTEIGILNNEAAQNPKSSSWKVRHQFLRFTAVKICLFISIKVYLLLKGLLCSYLWIRGCFPLLVTAICYTITCPSTNNEVPTKSSDNRVVQVFTNFVSLDIKFEPKYSITIMELISTNSNVTKNRK